MAYTSLYRKYRSQTFDDVLGQRHITQTLRNAVAANRVAHAYLFTGPRGSGKTSTARILAKALNCLATDGPNPDPCGVCEACVRIRDGSSMDVMEIDAASTRSIDDMRELRERVIYAPAQERTKVYIIDEVHQLTGEAFHAFLKTLEEPPASVVFILATTELHKVPVTILSRCQRFDFRRGSLTDIRERIESVCNNEGWTITPEALTALAVGANGGYRDALTLLEQVAAYTTDSAEMRIDDVNVVLGNLADEQLLSAVDAITRKDTAACFAVVEDALATGVEVRQFIVGLRARLRDLLLIAVGALPENAAVAATQRDKVSAQAKEISQADLLWCIDTLNDAEHDLRWSPQQRLLLETTLVKLASRTDARQPAPVEVVAAPQRETRPARPVSHPEAPRPAPSPVSRVSEPGTAATTPPPHPRQAPAKTPAHPPVVMEHYRPTPEDYDEIVAAWTKMIKGLKASSKQLMASFLPRRVENGTLVLGCPESIWVEKAQKNQDRAEGLFADVYGKRVALRFTLDTTLPPPRGHGSASGEPTYTQASLADLAAGILDAQEVPTADETPPGPFV